MTILLEVLHEELARLQSHIASYERLLAHEPKGYVSTVTVKGQRFAYRKWREGSKIKSQYVGLSPSTEEQEARAHYAERKRLEHALRTAKEDQRRLTIALRHYGKENN